MPTHNDYQVGWICALPLEFAAAEATLDTIHDTLPNRRDDENTYVFGSILQHNVVIACLPVGVYGTTSATSVGMQMRASFPSLRFCLLVGVAGGAPGPHADIRLGDVVVSKPTGGYGGVIQYDYGKAVEDGEFVLTGMLDKPPAVLLTALARLQGRHHLRGNDIHRFYKEALDKYGQLAETFSFPGRAGDVLFVPDYSHVGGSNNDCDNCDQDQIYPRPPRSSSHPQAFYGLVASANRVLRSAARRDALSRRHGILCFEMEAAGLIDILPCLVIRGICDYCDSHKNKQWQGYASMTAAAYAKELLSVIPSNEVTQTKTIKDGLSNTTNTPSTIPSGAIQTPSKETIKAPYSEPIDSGFGGPSSGNSHQTAVGVPSFKPQSVDLPVGKGSRLLIGIELGYEFSTAAWTTTEDFRSYKLNLITRWPGRSVETHQVPTELGYKDGVAFWGYSIPNDTPRLVFLRALHSDGERYAGKDHDDRSARKLVGDYILGIYCHVRRTIHNSRTVRLGNRKVQVVLVVPFSLQSMAKEVTSTAKQVFLSDESLPQVSTVLRSNAAALGQVCMLPTPSLGAYVICDMCVNSTDLHIYKLTSVNPMVLEEIRDATGDYALAPLIWNPRMRTSYLSQEQQRGVGPIVHELIEEVCRQKLQRSSVPVDSSDLLQAVITFREDILNPRFEVESPTRKYYIDVRGILLKRGIPDDYTYEPYMLRGHICLTDMEIATAFDFALDGVKGFMDSQMSFQEDLKIEGIVLAGSWGSNPYIYQHIASLYTDQHSIPVCQELNSHLPVLRGAIYMSLAGKSESPIVK